MKKRKLLFLIPIVILLAVYFGLYHQNKDLKYIPENADAIVLIDVKKLTRDYLSETLSHPSTWFEKSESKGKKSWLKSGVKIPDFVQFFHLKHENLSNWYTVLEIKDKEKLLSFLTAAKFQKKPQNIYSNGRFSLKISGKLLLMGTYEKSFSQLEKAFTSSKNKIRNADDFVIKGFGVLGILNEKKLEKYAINIGNDFIEISNIPDFKTEKVPLLKNKNSQHFLQADLDKANLYLVSKLFKSDIFSDSNINSLQLISDIKQQNDTIIIYDYDDNFNEVEKISYQKITQPQYFIQLKTKNTDAVWSDFKSKNQIDEKNQFTAIPFLPNKILKGKDHIVIHYKQHPTLKNESQTNFILIKNNPLLLSSIKSLSASDRKKLSELEYIFYHNNEEKRVLRLQFKPNELPLILR
ncbi:hypothetical protein [Chryseobacterium sp.]|uniref:hypothetical protein n=1 Tax=Chryseobacterium sp. TaxID=1871047 RepID=UPI0028A1A5A5|nr:hypothetical protein [Chryseobacterium sp.]